MNKALISIVLAAAIAAVGFIGYKNNNVTDTNQENKENIGEIENNENKPQKDLEKTLVVYFSAQGHTKEVAEKIANNFEADIFEIVPENEYTSEDLDWTNNNSRVSKEHNDETLRNVNLKTTKVDNWNEYQTIIIGYPIWWGIAAWPVDTFVKENDFTGKTVIPFCTSASSGLGQSGKLLEELVGNGNWQEGHRFSSSASEADIKEWTDSIK